MFQFYEQIVSIRYRLYTFFSPFARGLALASPLYFFRIFIANRCIFSNILRIFYSLIKIFIHFYEKILFFALLFFGLSHPYNILNFPTVY